MKKEKTISNEEFMFRLLLIRLFYFAGMADCRLSLYLFNLL